MYVTKIYPELQHDQAWQQGLQRSLELGSEDADEFWLANIATCFTAGLDLRDQPLDKDINGINVYRTRRAGGMTYYGPGQLHVCTVYNYERRPHSNWTEAVLRPLTQGLNQLFTNRFNYDLTDPGIYETSTGNKIASVGFFQHRGWMLGGVVINFCVDLAPYALISPCGVQQRSMGNILEYRVDWHRLVEFGNVLINHLTQELYHDQQNRISPQSS